MLTRSNKWPLGGEKWDRLILHQRIYPHLLHGDGWGARATSPVFKVPLRQHVVDGSTLFWSWDSPSSSGPLSHIGNRPCEGGWIWALVCLMPCFATLKARPRGLDFCSGYWFGWSAVVRSCRQIYWRFFFWRSLCQVFVLVDSKSSNHELIHRNLMTNLHYFGLCPDVGGSLGNVISLE